MAFGKRRYDDGCAMAQALDLVGERWALLVIRELMFGPKRFTDLRSDLPGITATVLTQRLEDLEAAGIVRRRILPPPGRIQVYELTSWGAQIEPAFRALGQWAARSPHLRPGPMSVASLAMSLRTMFSAEAAENFAGRFALQLDRHSFTAEVGSGNLVLEAGDAQSPDARLAADPDALAAVIYGGRPLEAAIAAGEVVVEGDVDRAKDFLALFPLPEAAG